MSGKVFLVGAGPGDADLLTLKAARLLSTAEVVVLDALVSDAIRVLINPAAEVIYAGKRASNHAMTQSEINDLLVRLGAAGRRVVRLKGGDPFVFGRGGEEAEALHRAGVAYEVVPGISSAIAGPAYAGIPVTHRTLATSVTVLTGHESDSSSGVDWQAIAQLSGTVVCLMGLSQLRTIASNLVAHGKAGSTPVAVISKATTRAQRTVTGTLSTIAAAVEDQRLEAPALIVVGEVVKMREKAQWFETRPLFGRRIVVTRARNQASSLATLLEEAGAEVVEMPTIEIAEPEDWSLLDRSIASLGSYDWLIFSSVNGVQRFFDRLIEKQLDSRALAPIHVAAVGNATADELRRRGIRADLVPDRFQSNALLPLFPDSLEGRRFAVIRAESGNDELLEALRARGADVELVVAYRTVAAAGDRERLAALLESRGVDAVTFTSGSTVDQFIALLEQPAATTLRGITLASIGPITSSALRRHGCEPHVEAAEATVEMLAAAVIEHYQAARAHAPAAAP